MYGRSVKSRKETQECPGAKNVIEETGNNFEKIFVFGILVQHGALRDLQATVTNCNHLSFGMYPTWPLL